MELGYVDEVLALAKDESASIGARVVAVEALGRISDSGRASTIIRDVVRESAGPVPWLEVADALRRLRATSAILAKGRCDGL